MSQIKHYSVLGLSPYATQRLINKTYEDLMKANEGSLTPEVSKAFEVLMDPMERQLYNEGIDYDSLDLYELTGLSPDLDEQEMKVQMRNVVKYLHPTANVGLPKEEIIILDENFKKITAAKEILENPTKRKEYDRTLTKKTASQTTGPTNIFSRRADQTYEIDGNDKESAITISFAQSILGGEVMVPVKLDSTCGFCMGKGEVVKGAQNGCNTCGGTGKLEVTTVNVVGVESKTKKICPDCNKLTQKVECSHCKGSGSIQMTIDAKVVIPAGISEEQIIRVAGMGEKGIRGGKDGDLLVRVSVEEDSRFVRDDDDLLYWHDITYTEAMLGTTFTVPSPRGDKEVKIKPLTPPDSVLRYRREGFPSNKGLAGSLIVHLRLVIPTEITEELRAKLIALDE